MEKLLKGRFGPDYQIDLDKKIARSRLSKPMVIDFAELADGIIKNNLGLGGFFLEAKASRIQGGVRIDGTGQELLLEGDWPAGGESRWCRMRVVKWTKGELPVARWVGEVLFRPAGSL